MKKFNFSASLSSLKGIKRRSGIILFFRSEKTPISLVASFENLQKLDLENQLLC